MRAGAAALALLLLAAGAAASAAEAPLQVGFAVPAQADGAQAVQGAQWALLTFHAAEPGSLGLDVAAGTATNHTLVDASAPLLPDLRRAAPDSSWRPGAVKGTLEPRPGAWASLVVEARSIRLEAAAAHAELGRAAPGSDAASHLPRNAQPDATSREGENPVAQEGAALSVAGAAGTGAGFAFTLRAEGVTRLEWHNLTLACPPGSACPNAPGQEAAPAPGVWVAMRAYTELQVPDGTLEGSGFALVAAAGGPSLGVAVAGSLRLPDAALSGTCGGAACPSPDGKTFLAAGNLTLAGLAPDPAAPGRLRGALSGAFQAQFDEAPAPAFPLATGAAVGAALVVVPVAAKLLLGLFARSARPHALRHPKRQALYDLIRAEPGLSFRAIQRRLAWPNGTLSNHMVRLVDGRLVTVRPHRNTVRYFENHGRYDGTWQPVVLLRDANLRSLHAWLAANPSPTQGDVLRHAEAAWGWRRSTTQDRLRSLRDGGLVEQVADGRATRYVARAAPVAAPA